MRRLVLAAIVIAAVAVAGVAQDKSGDWVTMGKQIVAQKHCVVCHIVEGKGGKIGKPLADFSGKPDDEIRAALMDPKKAIGPSTPMPAVKLSEDDLKAAIAYIKSQKS